MVLFSGLLMILSAAASPVLMNTNALPDAHNVLVVDARDEAAFLEAHIPGATHLDVDSLSEEQKGVVGMLKPMSALLPLYTAAGLDPKREIVVYSGLEKSSDLKQATRLFWALEYSGFPKVRLLDGGLSKWKAEGRPLESGSSAVKPGSMDALKGLKVAPERIATREEVMAAQSSKKGIIADLRSNELYTGASKKDFVERGGHIPGAKSQPVPDFVDDTSMTFKAPDVIRALLAADKKAKKSSVVTYCNTGRDATVGYAAYRIAGFEHVSVYDGSMAEWGNIAACPLATGSEKE
tara:strand:- start:2003 stop:2884 length:882 start_codon:yes stop_codon:yes gene_type:complete